VQDDPLGCVEHDKPVHNAIEGGLQLSILLAA
jgi:hypothetical protein